MTTLVTSAEGLDPETRRARRVGSSLSLVAGALLAIHAALLLNAGPRQAPTIDEIWHLPAGISYYQRGEFWCYHHNPPVMRWLYSWPAIVAGAEVDYSRYVYRPKSRQSDFEFGRDFLVANQQRYLELYNACRPVVMLVSVVCGWLIWRWSRALFGEIGGLISVWLWVFLPESLTHGMLLTTDMGATCFGFLATWLFWRYLSLPSLERALVCGVALGVAEGTKFSCIVLPLVWVALAAIRFGWKSQISNSKFETNFKSQNLQAGNEDPLTLSREGGGAGTKQEEPLTLTLSPQSRGEGTKQEEPLTLTLSPEDGGEGTRRERLTGRAVLGHALVVLLTSLVVLNDLYLFDGFGKPLGEFPFFSHTLTRQSGGYGPLGNRFQGTWLAQLPVPLPEQYLLGFDAQLADLDRGEYQKYLRGELKKGDGWWYYYAYGCLVKLPLGMLGIVALALVAFMRGRVFGRRVECEATISSQPCSSDQPPSLALPAEGREPERGLEHAVITTSCCSTNPSGHRFEGTPHPSPLPARPGRGDKAKAPPLLWLDELAVIGPGLVYFLSVSSNVGLQYFRYLLVCFPFLFVFCGRLGPVLERGSWGLRGVICSLLLSIPISVLPHHPYYLPYFNEAVGGPEGGPQHLADSSIDWGEGLLALRDWLRTHRPGEQAKLAYFGTMAPQVAGLGSFELPPFGPGFENRPSQANVRAEGIAPEIGPVPGLQAVSVNYILGISFPAPGGQDLRGLVHVPQGAYSYFAKFQPIAKPGYSMWVFDLSVEEVNRVRAELGMPEWRGTEVLVKEGP